MKIALRILGVLVILGILAALALRYVPPQLTPPNESLPTDWKPEPGRGEYVMRAGDCMACHTSDGGAPLAGGRGIDSPMGTIWASNITPDKNTGIGNWTLDQFRAAMVDGVAANGTHLYPAMPYENYRFMSESDLRALYDYLMHEVKPVNHAVQTTQLGFPFNLRFGIRAWNWLALKGSTDAQPTSSNEVIRRGQYLVEGAGHCAACHSPRTSFMAQDGTRLGDSAFLTGGTLDGWNVAALRGAGSRLAQWSSAELAAYLATGRNAHAVANGEMSLVVKHSLQYLNDQDIHAMTAFLKSINGQASPDAPAPIAPPGPRATPAAAANDAGQATAQMLTKASPDMPLGARLYLDNCAACHFVSGKGAAEIFPELQGNAMVLAKAPQPLLSVILNGSSSITTDRRPMQLVMQGYADRLNDEEVAALASFVRSAWGNQASPVTAPQAAQVRSAAPH